MVLGDMMLMVFLYVSCTLSQILPSLCPVDGSAELDAEAMTVPTSNTCAGCIECCIDGYWSHVTRGEEVQCS